METLYFYYEEIYDFGKPPNGIVFDQTQFPNKYYPKNPYFIPPFRNLFTIYQVKSKCCPYLCNSDKAKNDNEFFHKVNEFDHKTVRELLIFHYNKYQGNKNDFLNYCHFLINQDTWIIQDNFKKTILFEEIKSLQTIHNDSSVINKGFQSSLTDGQIQTQFDLQLNQLFQIIDDVGLYYNQLESEIESEKRYIETKLIPQLNGIVYANGEQGLIDYAKKYIKQCEKGLGDILAVRNDHNFKDFKSQARIDHKLFVFTYMIKVYNNFLKTTKTENTLQNSTDFQSSLSNMKNSTNIDTLIENIDNELIKLKYCSDNHTTYQYFNFHGAIKQLLDLIIQQDLEKQYSRKLIEYRDIITDLFESEYKTVFTKIVNVNDQTHEISLNDEIHYRNTVGIEMKDRTSIIPEDEFELFKGKSIEELNNNIMTSRISLYNHLLTKCECIYPKEDKDKGEIERFANIKNGKKIFDGLNLPLKTSGKSFENYVKELEFQKNNLRKNEFQNTDKKIFQNRITDSQTESIDPVKLIIETKKLKEWILSDYVKAFENIETELFNLGYLNNSYKWQKTKTELADFLCVLINYKYFKPIVNGKRIQDFHKRQFISERYGFIKTGLTETWKKKKPRFELAAIPFSWIKKPD